MLQYHIPADQDEDGKEPIQALLFQPSSSSQVGLYLVLAYDIQQLQPREKQKDTYKCNKYYKKPIFKDQVAKVTSPEASSITASCSSFETLFPISGKA